MMKKLFLFFIWFLFLSLIINVIYIYGEKVASLPELNKPNSIKIYGNQIYINDEDIIYIYSLNDFFLKKKIGKRGEGPREFQLHPHIKRGGVAFTFKDDNMLVSSSGKLTFFTQNGRYIKEIKHQTPFGIGEFHPIDDRYVCLGVIGSSQTMYFTVNFYNFQFKKGKEIFKIPVVIAGRSINPVTIGILPYLCTNENMIFVNDYKGAIHMFDRKGKKLKEVILSKLDEKYQKVKFTYKHKKKFIEYFKSDFRYKTQYERDKHLMKFPNYFPEIRDFRIADKKIYAVTFREKNQKKELYIINLKGCLIKKTMISLSEFNPRELTPYTIKNGKLYKLIENLDNEEWELHLNEI